MRMLLRDVTVAYPVNITAKQQSLFAHAVSKASFGSIGKSASNATYVIALNGVNIEVPEGGRIALVGRNGSGKSTLLKTMAGIITPRSGKRTTFGTVGCVLNLGSGLDGDRTGLENLRTIARLYGLNGTAYRNAVDDAAEFTELGPYLDFPVRTYSSGMTARLCFSIATARHADIMLIDEVIGTGDTHFVAKAVSRVKEICSKSGAVVIASHSYDVLSDFCDDAIWMESGKVKQKGALADVWHNYASES